MRFKNWKTPIAGEFFCFFGTKNKTKNENFSKRSEHLTLIRFDIRMVQTRVEDLNLFLKIFENHNDNF